MNPDQLRIQPGQEALTPEQEREAERFAQARIAAQLSTEPVDEAETEALLQETYAVAGLPPPTRICWVDGPLQLVAALASPSRMVRNQAEADASLEDSREQSLLGMGWSSICNSIEDFVWNLVWNSIEFSVTTHVWYGVGYSIEAEVVNTLRTSGGNDLKERISEDSVRAYYEAWWLVCARFFAVYLAPNEAQALAQFNERVSGYWLGREEAILVRRPRVLSLDAASRLHSETGKCLEYRDGWGFYAWHGVRVPERVILSPETLTREDFLKERNVEVRSVMQERLGARFVAELVGVVLDTSPRGTLYEVRLPDDDPERVARYVQVQDASTERQYVLRVPPTVQTAAEAVAWTFQVKVEGYRPAQET